MVMIFTHPGASQQSTAPAPASSTPVVPPIPDMAGRGDLILKHLNSVITWYHNVGEQLPTVGLPTDAIFQNNARSLAVQVVQQAFQAASADAVLTAKYDASAASGTTQDFSQLAPQLDNQIAQTKSEIAGLNTQISSNGKNIATLTQQRDRLQDNLELLSAEAAAIAQLQKFSSGNGAAGGTELQRSIAQLQRNVPEVSSTATTTAANKPASTSALSPVTQEASGLISEAESLFSQASSLHKIDLLNQQASVAEDLAKQLRAPLITQIHTTLATAANWAAIPATAPTGGTASTGNSGPAPTKQQFDALTAQFKRLSAVALPLSQEIINLDESRTNLTQWRQSLGQENSVLLRKVLTRVGMIALSLGFLSLLSFLSNRLIFRYIKDIRRRRQVLIMRRFIVGFLMGIVLILGFVSEFSSLATFAGFITAGIAVGLQTILLSVAAYFFLIGRYGIRVGDRISISGTTGDVIDVGLIRLYLMELAGTGNDLYPTGRIIVFPNSVLFQATVPLYKQIPGTDYAWHEVVALLNPAADAKLVGDKLLEAVNSVHETYRPDFERQHTASSRVLDIHIEIPAPSAHLQFASTGLELVVRYPVSLGRVAEADEQVTQKLLAALNTSADFKNGITGTPQIRVAIKG
jgi:small-conductance mechanosensitive channel